MKQPLNYKLLFSLILLLTCFSIPKSWAGEGIYPAWVTFPARTAIAANVFIEAPTNHPINMPFWSTIDSPNGTPSGVSASSTVIFEVVEDAHWEKLKNINLSVNLKVELWDKNNVALTPINETFVLNYDTTTTNTTAFRAFKIYPNAFKVKVTFISILSANTAILAADLPMTRLYAEVKVNSILNMAVLTAPTIGTATKSANEANLSIPWTSFAGAEEYDLEWTFYDKESFVAKQIAGVSTGTNNDFGFIFRNNTSRVTTTSNNYSIPLLYPPGYLFYRVRPVRYTRNGDRETGRWSSVLSGASSTLANFPHKIIINVGHEPQLTWQAQTTLAEEGKIAPAVKYYDASLRERQSVALSKASGTTIASQTIYDHQGRPAAQVMPAPTNETDIKFTFDRSINLSTVYTKENFDLDAFSNVLPTAMSNVNTKAGAARYFSLNNPDVVDRQAKFIPDAEGYPFAVTEFMPDQTGRISRQSGVGKDYALNSGRETQYFYGKPNQNELDRLFGNEVGDANHYLKNMVQDPNGQLSVSYVDAHGRTIATALAGDTPANLEAIPSYAATIGQNFESSLLTENIAASDSTLRSNYALLVSSAGLHTFNYGLNVDSVKVMCGTQSVCMNCEYAVKITISSKNAVLRTITGQSFTFAQIAALNSTNCIAPTKIINILNQTITLPIGQYNINKEIIVSKAALDKYTSLYMSNAACVPNLTAITNAYRAKIDPSACNIPPQTCEACFSELGTEANFIAAYQTRLTSQIPGYVTTQGDINNAKTMYLSAQKSCQYLCKDPTDCDIMLRTFTADYLPGGQYAEYNASSLLGEVTTTDPTSIFFTSTVAGK